MADGARRDSFLEYVLDQLNDVANLRAQAMFGGVGLYTGDIFFGLLARDVLYFKVDKDSRKAYVDAGSEPFKPYRERPMTMSYYNVPIEVLEHAPTLVVWAHRAVRAAAASTSTSRSSRRRVGRPRAGMRRRGQ